MIRSFAFTTQGKLHTQDIDLFLMPTLLADTNLFLWVDLEKPTEAEWKDVLAWARAKNLLTADVAYKDSVNPTFLP